MEALKADGRISYRELGDRFNIPHTTIFTRVQRLVKFGAIKRFTIEIDDWKLREIELFGESKNILIERVINGEQAIKILRDENEKPNKT